MLIAPKSFEKFPKHKGHFVISESFALFHLPLLMLQALRNKKLLLPF